MIPKEQMTAWQRWELASFDSPTPASAPAEPETKIPALPTVAELEDLREQSRQEGYAAGMAEGRLAGYDAGFNEGRVAGEAAGRDQALLSNQPVITQLNALLQGFDAALTTADQQIGAELVAFACDLASAMLRTALPIHPELLLPLINEAINALPVMQRNGKIWLHPDDIPLVRDHLQEELSRNGWQLMADPQIARGGCRIDTQTNQIDATLPVRWERLMTDIGQKSEWLKT